MNVLRYRWLFACHRQRYFHQIYVHVRKSGWQSLEQLFAAHYNTTQIEGEQANAARESEREKI